MPTTTPYKRKGNKMEFSNDKSDTSSDYWFKHHKKQQDSRGSRDENKQKNKYGPYEELSRDFKKIELAMFNGKLRREKR